MAEKIESRTEPSPKLPVKIIITRDDIDDVDSEHDVSMDTSGTYTDAHASFQSVVDEKDNDTVRDVSQDEEVIIETLQSIPGKATVTPEEEKELKKLDRSHSSNESLEDVIAVSHNINDIPGYFGVFVRNE